MFKQIVEIEPHESETVERLFYEYNAGKENIAFLMRDKQVNYDILQEYINVVEARYVELEMMKIGIGEKYKPLPDKDFDFEFDFRNHSIIYTEA